MTFKQEGRVITTFCCSLVHAHQKVAEPSVHLLLRPCHSLPAALTEGMALINVGSQDIPDSPIDFKAPPKRGTLKVPLMGYRTPDTGGIVYLGLKEN